MPTCKGQPPAVGSPPTRFVLPTAILVPGDSLHRLTPGPLTNPAHTRQGIPSGAVHPHAPTTPGDSSHGPPHNACSPAPHAPGRRTT